MLTPVPHIRSRELSASGMWDWSHANERLPGKMCASDIDGIVEVNGCFLYLEGKRPGQTLPTGQRILFERLLLLSPRNTVVVLWGDPAGLGHPTAWQVLGDDRGIRPTDGWGDLQAYLDTWVAWAKAQPPL